MRTASHLILVLAVAAGLAGCADDSDRDDSAEPRTPVDEATVDQLVANPGAYDGAEVIVRGGTYVPIGPEGGFVLEGRKGSRILVSAPRGVPRLEAGETVAVRGELVRFTEPAADALGAEFAAADELAETPTDVGDPYLLLRSLPDAAAAGASTTPEDIGLGAARAELAAIVEDPDGRYGEEASIAGRVVRVGRAAFVLEADRRRLLVVPQSPPSDIPSVGAVVRAEGEIERMPADDDPAVLGERDLFDDFAGQPTLAASEHEVVGS